MDNHSRKSAVQTHKAEVLARWRGPDKPFVLKRIAYLKARRLKHEKAREEYIVATSSPKGFVNLPKNQILPEYRFIESTLKKSGAFNSKDL